MGKVFVPVSPGGTVIHWLKSEDEATAWVKLLVDAQHMPYAGKEGFEQRGYRVVEMSEADLKTKSWFPPAARK